MHDPQPLAPVPLPPLPPALLGPSAAAAADGGGGPRDVSRLGGDAPPSTSGGGSTALLGGLLLPRRRTLAHPLSAGLGQDGQRTSSPGTGTCHPQPASPFATPSPFAVVAAGGVACPLIDLQVDYASEVRYCRVG